MTKSLAWTLLQAFVVICYYYVPLLGPLKEATLAQR